VLQNACCLTLLLCVEAAVWCVKRIVGTSAAVSVVMILVGVRALHNKQVQIWQGTADRHRALCWQLSIDLSVLIACMLASMAAAALYYSRVDRRTAVCWLLWGWWLDLKPPCASGVQVGRHGLLSRV
jgi:hypothetical protein